MAPQTISEVDFAIPAPYAGLYELAYNLWWSWHQQARDLWRMIDPALWEMYRNPIELLAACDESTWDRLSVDDDFQRQFDRVMRDFDAYMTEGGWWDEQRGAEAVGPIAYLCAEFGVHASLPIYSGGLGVLAGDHAKSASDLSIPLVATGLLYRRGYFRQEIDAEGNQQHTYPHLDLLRLPIRRVAGPAGGQLKVPIEFPGRTVLAALWNLQVGKTSILLLDTDTPENRPEDRPITHTLYVRGREMRFCQELVLGVGSVRALNALGIEPSAWHINEGHAAMSVLERIRVAMDSGMSLADAEEFVRSNTAFTLHTPIPAGNETFDFSIAEKYLGSWQADTGTDLAYLQSIGQGAEGTAEAFDLGALAIRFAGTTNGVSARHGEIVNRDWSWLLRAPALGITNGVHPGTWLSRGVQAQLSESPDRDWHRSVLGNVEVEAGPALWHEHLVSKRVLTSFVRGRVRRQLARQGASPDELRSVSGMFPADRLTIGFARRFTAYKRATLLLHNLSWLHAILTNPDRPVQIVFAGKAHPADSSGQDLIRQIVSLAKTPEFSGHLFILEDYDMRMGRFLVQGCDVWVNAPRPPREASGTSGMKAAMNGVLNLSVEDGWWIEGFDGKNGWVFGQRHENGNHSAQDNEDAISLYTVLQDQVVPAYYERNSEGVPEAWVEMMASAIGSAVGKFSSHRMVAEYAEAAYLPLSR